MVLIIAFSIATSLPALNARCLWAWRDNDCRRGSITISLAPFFAAFLMKAAATGGLSVGVALITMITAASIAAANGADTAPEFRPAIKAATDEAWHSRVQWSTLLEQKPVRTSFWNRYASSFEPLAEPKPASAFTPFSSRILTRPLAAMSSASSQDASRKCVNGLAGAARLGGHLF